MATAKSELVRAIETIADRIAGQLGLEIVEVELKGSGPARMLRVTIDKPGSEKRPEPGEAPTGVTHQDCELLSRRLGEELDTGDVVPGVDGYTLEVSSPGVERKLRRAQDFERFVGQQIKVGLFEPVDNSRSWIGTLTNFESGIISLEPVPGQTVKFRLEQVSKANLKYDW